MRSLVALLAFATFTGLAHDDAAAQQKPTPPPLVTLDNLGSRVERVAFAWERGKVGGR